MSEPDPTSDRTWSVIELLNATREFLDSKEFQNPRTNAELLLGHVLGLSRIELYLKHDRPVGDEERLRLRELLKRRLQHEPPQYIVGETEFYGVRLRVAPGVPIPRPETEIAADKAIEVAKAMITESGGTEPFRVLDIGTGTGNLAIAIAMHIPQAIVEAVDISEKALDLALTNAARAGVADRVHPHFFDIFSDRIPPHLHPPYSLVVSNPPYIPESELDSLPPEVRDFEPRGAFVGGADGLRFYRRFAELANRLLEQNGVLVVEIGDSQASQVSAILKSAFANLHVFQDLAGADRVVVAEGLSGA
ncbi:MAG: peptide chain release factor N(5)-glutamine methyltransferase [bacterium]